MTTTRRQRPESRAARARKAEQLLWRLLRTPKTRNGLIAAVSNNQITRNFVYGFLSEQITGGKVVKLKSGEQVLYQASGYVIKEQPRAGTFPEWLEPRTLPDTEHRRVFLNGRPIEEQQGIDDEDEEQDTPDL